VRSVSTRGFTFSWFLALLAVAPVSAFIGSAPANAQTTAKPPLQGAELLAMLRAGGSVLYFRHADTDHAQKDTQGMNFDDCAAQRNLTERGRDNARAIGEALRALGIPTGTVLASPYCRTVETAMLAFGAAEKSMAVREGGPLPPGSPGRFTALRVLLSTPPAPGTNTVIVGHGYPFYALVGGQNLDEGEAAVVRPGSNGFEVVARVWATQWRGLGPPAADR
jgi:phosphohistidine phosphatase SixA